MIEGARRVGKSTVVEEFVRREYRSYIIYLCDTGLLVTMSMRGSALMDDEMYGRMLLGEIGINNGMYFENIVAQELTATGRSLYYAKFTHPDSKRIQELDFVIIRGRKIAAVEVKSGKRPRMHKSLDRYIDRYADKVDEAFVVCTTTFSWKKTSLTSRYTWFPCCNGVDLDF